MEETTELALVGAAADEDVSGGRANESTLKLNLGFQVFSSTWSWPAQIVLFPDLNHPGRRPPKEEVEFEAELVELKDEDEELSEYWDWWETEAVPDLDGAGVPGGSCRD